MTYKIANQKEMFQAFEVVRKSGITNMFDTDKVIMYAKKLAHTVMVREDIIDIMKNYSKYKKEFN